METISGRHMTTKRNGKIVSLTLKEEVIKNIEKIAIQEERERNNVIRKAINEYINKYNNKQE